MIVVVGSGFLGSSLLQAARDMNGEETVVGTYRDPKNMPAVAGVDYVKCDLTQERDILSLREKCSGRRLTVFFTAACHNIDFVCQNRKAAAQMNVAGLEAFYALMPPVDKLFFTSTDCVYGENPNGLGKHKEDDPLRPVNVYGHQKLAAEQIVLAHGHCVVRLPFLFGPSPSPKKSFYDNVCEKLRRGEPVEMIDGMVRSSLTYETTAGLLLKLSSLPKEEIPPVVNVCSDAAFTKYDVGVRIAETIGAPVSLVKKITEQEGQKFFIDVRAKVSVMDNSLLKNTLQLERIE